MTLLLPPLVSFDAITLDEINGCLVAWGHRMGPLQRPDFGFARFHGLRHSGKLVAVDALQDWERVTTTTRAHRNQPRTEVLWLNPAAAAARSQRQLFATVA